MAKVIKRARKTSGTYRVTFTIYQDMVGQFRWRAIRGGRIVADSSEGYTRQRDAKRAVTRFIEGVQFDVIIAEDPRP